MKQLLVFLVVILFTAVGAMGQARTASSLQTSAFSALDSGNPPIGSVRYCINCKRQNGACLAAGVGETPVGSDALKTPDGWMCSARASGVGTGTVENVSVGNLSPLFTSSVATSTTTPAVTFSLSTQAAKLFFGGPTSGGAAAPTFRAILPADFITGTVTNSRCLRTDGSGNVVVAAADCGAGGGGTWGSITGTLSDQTDLQSALDNKQGGDSDLTAIAGLSPANDDVIQRKAGAWTNRTMAQVKTDLALTKSDVGLSNVDNTSDANKPVSTATQAALDGKQPLDSDLTTIAGLTATTDNFLVSVASAWASRTPAQVKTTLSLNNVDNTSDANKPVSTAQQTALNLKADLASPTFTGTPTLPTGTIAVTQSPGDSTTKVATTAFVTTADNLKADLASPTFTGTPTLPSGTIQAGSLLATAIAAPSTPAAGKGSVYVDSTSKNLAVKDDAGVVKHGVQTKSAVANNFLTAINDAGAVTAAQPAFTDISGSVTDAQVPNNITVDLATTATTANAGDSATAFFTSGTLEAARGGTGVGTPAEDQILIGNGTTFELKTLPSCSNGVTDKLLYNSSTNAVTCGADQTTGGGSGITTLNTLTAATQTFSKTDDTNVTLTITSASADHNFALGWAGTLAKARQNAATVYNDQANTYSTGLQDFSSVTSFVGPAKLKRTATATNLTIVAGTHRLVAVTDTSAARTITLPDSATAGAGAEFTIVDESNGALTNNVTVTRAGSDVFLGGNTSVIIDINGGVVTVYTNGAGTWFIK
jgi:hypothetical protein